MLKSWLISHKKKVSPPLAALVARTIFSEERGGFFAESGSLEEPDARAVVEQAVKKLFNSGRIPSVETLKLQSLFESAVLEGEQGVQKQQGNRGQSEQKLVDEILTGGNGKNDPP